MWGGAETARSACIPSSLHFSRGLSSPRETIMETERRRSFQRIALPRMAGNPEHLPSPQPVRRGKRILIRCVEEAPAVPVIREVLLRDPLQILILPYGMEETPGIRPPAGRAWAGILLNGCIVLRRIDLESF